MKSVVSDVKQTPSERGLLKQYYLMESIYIDLLPMVIQVYLSIADFKKKTC